ncbi:hypothetical protein F4802DRAFT_315873 [Xylaria palmicola]|nr:hypothetical protein F4802DRAFT_315873 [Xylaria palmicola]
MATPLLSLSLFPHHMIGMALLPLDSGGHGPKKKTPAKSFPAICYLGLMHFARADPECPAGGAGSVDHLRQPMETGIRPNPAALFFFLSLFVCPSLPIWPLARLVCVRACVRASRPVPSTSRFPHHIRHHVILRANIAGHSSSLSLSS